MKLLYLGNSITLHETAPEFYWYGKWGMAATAKEKDYVHTLNQMLEENGISVEYEAHNIKAIELHPETYDLDTLSSFLHWKPDILIVRLGENVPADQMEEFTIICVHLIELFQKVGTKVYVSGLYYQNEMKESYLQQLGELPGVTFISLKGMHSKEHQAIGQFEHPSVAAHPSDKGMKYIAEAIYDAMHL